MKYVYQKSEAEHAPAQENRTSSQILEYGELELRYYAPKNLVGYAEALRARNPEIRIALADHPVSEEWIGTEELAARPDLVKTVGARPPETGGQIRLVRIGEIDLQPCGGTHVRSTAEIGALRIGKIEKKGRANRRINLHFAQ